jgi:hypothetical protein
MKLLFLLSLICSLNVNGQDDSCILIRYPNYKVVLYQSMFDFGSNKKEPLYAYIVPLGKIGNCKPWTLSVEQVKNLDSHIKSIIEEYVFKMHLDSSQVVDFKYIIHNIDSYNRRYFSCLSKSGDKIVYVDFSIRKADDNLDLADKKFFAASGGGRNYFSLTFDFSLGKVINLHINSDW